MTSIAARLAGILLAGLAAVAVAGPASARVSCEAIYNARCKSCHEPPVERAPSRADLAQRPAADVARSLTTGIMKPMAVGLSPSPTA